MKKKLKKGFTLVELVIVIAVIAILSAVLIPTFGNVISNANDSAAFSTASNALTKYTTNQAQAGQSTMLPDGYVLVFDKEQTFANTDITVTPKYVFEFKNGSLKQYKDESAKSFIQYADIKDDVIKLGAKYKSQNDAYVYDATNAADQKTTYLPIKVEGKSVTYFGAYVLDGAVVENGVSGKVLLLAKATNTGYSGGSSSGGQTTESTSQG